MSNTPLPPWFAIQTRPRCEKHVATQLESKGYEVFLPTYRARRRWSDRTKIVVLPLFDSYVFCRLDLGRSARVITTQGVVRFVGIAGEPAAIDDQEIAALQQIVAAAVDVEPWSYLQVGQRVCIMDGALSGIEGILESARGRDRLIVSVTLLQRAVAVEVDRESVVPVDQESIAWVAARMGR
jgi:transcriptional antiterminator RfaH